MASVDRLTLEKDSSGATISGVEIGIDIWFEGELGGWIWAGSETGAGAEIEAGIWVGAGVAKVEVVTGVGVAVEAAE